MNRLIQKITSYLALMALVVPMFTLAMPTAAQAATTIGGTTSSYVGMNNVVLSEINITSEATGDIANGTNIEIILVDSTALANVQFDTSVFPDVSVTGSSLQVGLPITMTNTSIAIPVSADSAQGDMVTIKNIRVRATQDGTTADYLGSAHLDITTNGTDTDSCTSFTVDSQIPVVNNLTSNATDGGAAKIGDGIQFSFSTTEALKSVVSDSYNGYQLNWSTTDGLNYSSQYVVTEGDKDGQAPQLANVVITDLAGNVSVQNSTTNVNKIIDASKPVLFVNPQNTIYPSGDVPYEWVIVFQGNTDPGRMVYLEVNSDPIKHQTLSTPDGEWRFEVSASDLGAGSHTAKITVADSSSNENSFNLSFSVNEPVVKAAYSTQGAYAVGSSKSGTSAYGTTPRGAVTPSGVSDEQKEEIKDGVEDAAEGIIKAAETQDDSSTSPWQTVVTVIAILIIAIGVGTAGYYGYEWWATRSVAAVASTGPAENWDEPVAKKKTVKKTAVKKKTSTKKSGRRSSSRW